MTKLHFAQLSDIHISALGDHHEMLSGRAAGFLAETISRLNGIESLDFVLITGDLFDTAAQSELEQFQAVIQALEKPCYIIPGNHDRRPPDKSEGLTRRQFARQFNPQFELRSGLEPAAQAGYWSLAVDPAVQLIGLDSIRDKDWGGEIDAQQQAWLTEELLRCADKLVIVAVHHPFHSLAPIDRQPEWTNFVCDDGPEMLTLLDDYPQVKLVLTGHHHLTRVDWLGERLHAACPALSIYPCAYRTFQVSQTPEGWQVEWRTHPAVDAATLEEARRAMLESWQEEAGFAEDFVQRHIDLAYGRAGDQAGETVL